jgi:arylsulfatase A-like enzyme/Flp pilus assembly protein TadD
LDPDIGGTDLQFGESLFGDVRFGDRLDRWPADDRLGASERRIIGSGLRPSRIQTRFGSAPYINFVPACSTPERISLASCALRLTNAVAAHFRGGLGGRLVIALGLLVLIGCGPPWADSDPPERVVLITVDTLRADHVGCYGAARAHTPHMDALAASGVRFVVAIAPTPVTLPSHASLMTALDPPAHGVRHNSIYALSQSMPTLAEQMQQAGFQTAAFVGAAVLDARFGLARGFGHYDDTLSAGRTSGAVGYAERRAAEVVDAALAWMDDAPPRFFAWLHFYDPHASHDPPVGFASAFASAPYAGEIAYTDAQIGRLLEGIGERFGADGLAVALTSDHGESLGEHGEITHSYTIYDATQRVPLLMAGPGLPERRVVRGVVRLIDVAPTLLALAGANPLAGAAGIDLRPLIAGERSAEREAAARGAYVETLATQLDHGWSPLLGLRTARFKYIRAPRAELYDLVVDPAESSNRAAQQPEAVARLDRHLSQLTAAAQHHAPAVMLSEADRGRLESLGYAVPDGEAISRERLGVVGGVDPKDAIGVLKVIADAHTALSEGRNQDALVLLLAQGDRGHVIAAMRAAAALEAGEFAQAQSDARSVLHAQPNRPDLWIILARSLEGSGDASAAAAAYRQSLELDASSAAAHTGLGRVSNRLGSYADARDAFEASISLAPLDPEPRWRLAVSAIRNHEPERAHRALESLEPGVVRHPAVAIQLARAEEAVGRTGAAREYLRGALDAHSGNERLRRELQRMTSQEIQ